MNEVKHSISEGIRGFLVDMPSFYEEATVTYPWENQLRESLNLARL